MFSHSLGAVWPTWCLCARHNIFREENRIWEIGSNTEKGPPHGEGSQHKPGRHSGAGLTVVLLPGAGLRAHRVWRGAKA